MVKGKQKTAAVSSEIQPDRLFRVKYLQTLVTPSKTMKSQATA
jgi:hypothetical protein